MAAEMGSPVELRFDLPREDMATLMARAGIYLHTIHPPEATHGAPIGMPISIAEAMATGAYVLVRELPELVDYVGEAGAVYRDAAQAAEIIAATTQWSDSEWRRRRVRASDFAFVNYADEVVFRPILEDWQALARQRADIPDAKESAGAA
jgi:glycosyltransferase involved in cell wall biosynthesis